MPLDPFFTSNPVLASLIARDAARQRHAENASRHASCYVRYSTHGQGQLAVPSVQPFDVTFVEEPRVNTGWNMDGDTLITGNYPMVSAGVWKWQQNRRGFYIGAWLVINIIGDASYDIDHHFTFHGVAMKDLSPHLMEN